MSEENKSDADEPADEKPSSTPKPPYSSPPPGGGKPKDEKRSDSEAAPELSDTESDSDDAVKESVESAEGDSGQLIGGLSQKTWAMVTHLSSLVSYLVGNLGIGVLPPLLIWLILKDRMPAIDKAGKAAVNFNLTVLLAVIGLTAFVFFTCGLGGFIAWIGYLLIAAWQIFGTIKVGLAANEGRDVAYPGSIPFIK